MSASSQFWMPPNCTCRQNPWNATCGACSQSQPGWQCSKCSYMNQQSSQMCEQCSYQNPTTLNQTIICSTCTFANPKTSARCQMCMTLLTTQSTTSSTNPFTSQSAFSQNTFSQGWNSFGTPTNSNSQPFQFQTPRSKPSGLAKGVFIDLAAPMDPMDVDEDDDIITQPPIPPVPPPPARPSPSQQAHAPSFGQTPMFGQMSSSFGGFQPAPPQPAVSFGSWVSPVPSSFAATSVTPSQFGQPSDFSSFSWDEQSSFDQSRRGRDRPRKRHKKHRRRHQSYEPSQDAEEEIFVDTVDLMNKERNETQRLQKEETEVQELGQFYADVMLPEDKNIDLNLINQRIVELFQGYVPPRELEIPAVENQRMCQACYCPFDESADGRGVLVKECDHLQLCVSCFKTNLSIAVRDDEIMPWFMCPAPNCKVAVQYELVIESLSKDEKLQFIRSFLRKSLARNSNWVSCKSGGCEFGFMHLGNVNDQVEDTCRLCWQQQIVSKNPVSDMQELLDSGEMKLCPKCQMPTFKDKGICNVIQCGQCSIWWNWRTFETGTSSTELKRRARRNGTLWEPGELRYQQNLQRRNPEEFRKLLERNGIKYDPNYVRGS